MSAAEVRRLGVVGAGTMGAGIAQVAALAGFETHLHDPFAEALDRGLETIGSAWRRASSAAAGPAATRSWRCSASTARIASRTWPTAIW